MFVMKAEEEAIPQALDVLRKNGLIVYPTDTLYGLGGQALKPGMLERINEIKQRPNDQPISVCVSDMRMMEDLAFISRRAQILCDAFLPGPLTLLLNTKVSSIPDPIGIRYPDNDFTLKLVKTTGPLTATSANLNRAPSPNTIEEARKQLGEVVGLYLDYGPCNSQPSTIVDLSAPGEPKLVREGSISFDKIMKALEVG